MEQWLEDWDLGLLEVVELARVLVERDLSPPREDPQVHEPSVIASFSAADYPVRALHAGERNELPVPLSEVQKPSEVPTRIVANDEVIHAGFREVNSFGERAFSDEGLMLYRPPVDGLSDEGVELAVLGVVPKIRLVVDRREAVLLGKPCAFRGSNHDAGRLARNVVLRDGGRGADAEVDHHHEDSMFGGHLVGIPCAELLLVDIGSIGLLVVIRVGRRPEVEEPVGRFLGPGVGGE